MQATHLGADGTRHECMHTLMKLPLSQTHACQDTMTSSSSHIHGLSTRSKRIICKHIYRHKYIPETPSHHTYVQRPSHSTPRHRDPPVHRCTNIHCSSHLSIRHTHTEHGRTHRERQRQLLILEKVLDGESAPPPSSQGDPAQPVRPSVSSVKWDNSPNPVGLWGCCEAESR